MKLMPANPEIKRKRDWGTGVGTAGPIDAVKTRGLSALAISKIPLS